MTLNTESSQATSTLSNETASASSSPPQKNSNKSKLTAVPNWKKSPYATNSMRKTSPYSPPTRPIYYEISWLLTIWSKTTSSSSPTCSDQNVSYPEHGSKSTTTHRKCRSSIKGSSAKTATFTPASSMNYIGEHKHSSNRGQMG